MIVAWEESANTDFYGYLKLLDTQKDGYDLHATFVKQGLPHLSLYLNDTTGTKKEYQAPLSRGWNSSFSLAQNSRTQFATLAPSSANVIDAFLIKVQEKQLELTTPVKSTVKSTGFGSALPTTSTWGGKQNDIRDTTSFPSLPSPASKPVVKQAKK